MTIAQLVRKLLEAGATPELVEITLAAVEEARQEAQAPARRRRRAETRKPEIVSSRA